MKCAICGYGIERLGCCQRNARYDKKTGEFNRGRVCHESCAVGHYRDHFDLREPRSIASMQLAERALTAREPGAWVKL